MKKHIPNTITCCNLICGCIATYFALQPSPRYDFAFAFIVGGAVFDFFDGLVARLLGVSSPIGKELDSLADAVTFGVAPASIVFALMSDSLEYHSLGVIDAYLPFLAFIIAAFSALRLAKFNLDERQTMGFIGLPTPANALFWSSLAVSAADVIAPHPYALWGLMAGILLSAWLLVCEIPMFALKFKHFGWRGNALRYSFAVISLGLIAAFGLSAFTMIVPFYVLISVSVCFFLQPGE